MQHTRIKIVEQQKDNSTFFSFSNVLALMTSLCDKNRKFTWGFEASVNKLDRFVVNFSVFVTTKRIFNEDLLNEKKFFAAMDCSFLQV